jgi:hypothetical protein
LSVCHDGRCGSVVDEDVDLAAAAALAEQAPAEASDPSALLISVIRE